MRPTLLILLLATAPASAEAAPPSQPWVLCVRANVADPITPNRLGRAYLACDMEQFKLQSRYGSQVVTNLKRSLETQIFGSPVITVSP